MTTNEAIIMIVVGVSIFIFIAGYILGELVEKRKRDKEMAGIVAERLLRKPEVPSSSTTQLGSGWQNANMNQLGAMQGQSSMLGGLIGNSARGSSKSMSLSQYIGKQ
jgi:hypothetical protein